MFETSLNPTLAILVWGCRPSPSRPSSVGGTPPPPRGSSLHKAALPPPPRTQTATCKLFCF